MSEQEEAILSCNFLSSVAKRDKMKVGLLFESKECETCQVVDQVREKVENQKKVKTPIVVVEKEELENTECKNLADESGVRVFPTLVVWKDGKPFETIFFNSSDSEEEIEKKLTEVDSV
jgi:thioredoxin-related protein